MINFYVKLFCSPGIHGAVDDADKLDLILKNQGTMMTKLDDQLKILSDNFTAIGGKVDVAITETGKVKTETISLQEKIAALQQSLPAGVLSTEQQAMLDGLVTQSQTVLDAAANLGAKLQEVDDLVPDAPAGGGLTEVTQDDPT